MKKIFFLFCLAAGLFSCSEPAEVTSAPPEPVYDWTNLVDSDLSQWDTYLSYQHQPGYDGTQPKDADGKLMEPVGLNQPGYDVFTAVKENGEDLIRVSGEYYGCIISKKEYRNYHFQLKFKWGDKKWTPRKEKLKDSGILYHSIGANGAEHWRSWMQSQEFQVMEGHIGDFWKQANSAIDIRAYPPESVMSAIADETQDFLPIGKGEDIEYFCMRSDNHEKPHGEWNTLDLICYEGKSLHIVNGEVVMILQNSRYVDEEGNKVPMIEGKIQLQSEAAELFYKDIKIRKIDAMTEEQAMLF